jgi:hypothetical protein
MMQGSAGMVEAPSRVELRISLRHTYLLQHFFALLCFALLCFALLCFASI